MQRLIVAAAIAVLTSLPAYAQNAATCNAVSSDGKALTGAAKASFLKKCCEDSAKSSEGKALAGAAKKSYVDKCMKG